MNQKSVLEIKNEYYLNFSNQFPKLESEIIFQAIDNFNCDYLKIQGYLMNLSFHESTSSNRINRTSSEIMKPNKFFSSVSFNNDRNNSDSNSPPIPMNQYRNLSELNTISSQNGDLMKLEKAFNQMELNKEDLSREMEFLEVISQKRKSFPNFPTITELEDLERSVNQKYLLLPKSMSYTNDLRSPEDMNVRYRSLQQPYNQNLGFKKNNRRKLENAPIGESLNPNFYNSPKATNNLLLPFKKQDEKRNSAHYPDGIELPEELTGHRHGHSRQKSDPWITDNNANQQNVNSRWNCPQCLTLNTLPTCSFCECNRDQFERFRSDL